MATNNREIKKIGIVVSGGLSRGVVQLAFIKSLIEKIGYDRISVVSGSSIGALNAFAISSQKIDELLKFYSGLDLDNIRGFLKAMKGRFYSKAFNVAESDKLHAITYVNATKMPDFDPYYFCLNNMSRQDIKKAVDASMGFPVLNGRKRFNGKLFIDGGATDNCPYYPMEYYDLDMIIIVHCHAKYYPKEYMLKDDRILVDIDSSLQLSDKITPFSFTKDIFTLMIDSGLKEGKIFADYVFQNFDFNEVKQRCRDYTLERVNQRREKSKDLLNIVEITNEIYRLKIEKY